MPRRSVGDQAADFIRELIVAGELRRDDRVVPEDIAAELGMSRIPVREGLIALEREGWVAVERHRGTFVRGIDRQTVRDHHVLLGIIFGIAATRAVERATADQIAELASLQRGDQAAFIRHLLAVAGSTRAQALVRVMPTLLSTTAIEAIPRVAAARRKGTAAIVRALKARDANAAMAAATSLFDRLGEQVLAVLGERGVFVADETPATPPRARAVASFRPASFAPLSGTNGADRVASYLRDQIVHGKLAPNERIDQTRIAEEVGVSRTPVREAVIALEREGWLTIEPHRGAFVHAFDATTVEDHYRFFGLFFGFAVRRVAEHLDQATLDRFLALNATVQAATDVDTFEAANRELVDLLVTEARSNPLVAVLRAMPEVIPGNFFAAVPGTMEIQRKGIARMCAALKRGDAATAEAAWTDMFARLAQRVIALF